MLCSKVGSAMSDSSKPDVIVIPASPRERVIIDKAELDALQDEIVGLRRRLDELDPGVPHEIMHAIYGEGRNPVTVWRECRGLTKAELARRGGVSRSYLGSIEHGRKPISTIGVGVMAKLADVLGCDIEDLLPPKAE